jgi:transketolase
VLDPSDQFILSKGHAAGALYVTLWSVGHLSDDDLKQFHADGTRFSGHPTPNSLPELPFATGSLGHGLSLAAGLALVKKLKGEPGRVYCLLSDGEWQEGSTWEALIFTRRHQLPVTLLIDCNGLQGFGTTAEIAQMGDLPVKIEAFGLPVQEIDGHDVDAILRACGTRVAGPLAIVARTHKGAGVSFMQDQMAWHYLPLSDDQYRQAISEVTKV